ncbi:MAG: hypothetical protein ACE3JK_14950 [Sporolactobacillus sp.]
MPALLLAILFWLAGTALLAGGYLITGKLKKTSDQLLTDAEHEKGKDNSASIAMTIEGKILDYVPSYLIHLSMSIVGLLFIVIGFVALAFFFD